MLESFAGYIAGLFVVVVTYEFDTIANKAADILEYPFFFICDRKNKKAASQN